MAVVIEPDKETAVIGEELSFNFTVTNRGTQSARDVSLRISYQPQPEVSLVSTSPEGQCFAFVCNLGDIGVNESVVVKSKILVELGFDTLQLAKFSASADVSGIQRDSNIGNNQDSASIAFDLDKNRPGSVIWRNNISSSGAYFVHGPDILYVLYYSGSDFHAVEKDTGEVRWSYITEDRVSFRYADASSVIIVSGDSVIYSLDAATRDVNWRYDAGTEGWAWHGFPRVIDGEIYFAHNLRLYSLDASTGELNWSHVPQSRILNGPYADNGVIYYETYPGTLWSLNSLTGDIIWSSTWDARGGGINGSPIFTKDTMYVANSEGMLNAINRRDGSVLWTRSLMPFNDYDTSAMSLDLLSDGVLYLSKDGGENAIIAVDIVTKETLWQTELQTNGYNSNRIFEAVNGKLYVVSATYDYDGNEEPIEGLYVFNAATGALQWHFQASMGASPRRIEIFSGVVYVTSYDGYVNAVDDSTGALLWRFNKKEGTPSTISEGVLYVGSGSQIFALVAHPGD